MLIYEVNLFVNPTAYNRFILWLEEHVSEMLTIEGFLKADLWEWAEEQSPPDLKNICVQYHLDSEEKLNQYFEVHAHRMRDEGLKRFPGEFRATRRVLKNFSGR